MIRRADAAVVGAGPAGCAAATVLAERGFSVLLLEKDPRPRRKICGELLSGTAGESLERLGVTRRLEALRPERIDSGTLLPPRAPGIAFRLPETALGISRRRLDGLLVERALEAGATLAPARVVSVEPEGRRGSRLRLAAAGGEVTARVVVGAWGRWDALDRALGRPFLAGRKYFGFARDFRNAPGELEGEVRVYLYPGGYCGLSRIEGGRTHLAGIVAERVLRRLRGGWSSVLTHARRSNAALARDLSRLRPDPGGFAGGVPLVFTAKRPTEDGMLLAGDSAGFLDAFAGEGQAAALASGILAGDGAARLLRGEISREELAAAYEKEWRARFAPRFLWGGLLRRLVLAPRAADLAARIAGARLVGFGLRHLKAEAAPADQNSSAPSGVKNRSSIRAER